MKIAVFLDEVSQSIDNAMQWNVMSQIRDALCDQHEVVLIDPLKIGLETARNQLLQQEYDLLLTYNKTGTNLIDPASGRNLMSMLDRPQFSWLTEHPVTFCDQYRQSNSSKRNYIFPNPRHDFFASNMGIQGRSMPLLFGSSVKPISGDYAKRPYDICIAAQWRGPADANAFWLKRSGLERQFFEDINTLQHMEDHGDVFTAFLAAAEHHRVPLDRKTDFALPLKALYWHARKTERIKMVQDLVASGLKILLIGGPEWKQVLPRSDNVTFAPHCTHQELMGHYMQSRAVASTNCFNGANERTFDALSCGAISIAEDSPTLTCHFKDLENIVFYPRMNAQSKIPQLIELLNNTSASEAVAEQGRQTFLAAHTWTHRAQDLSAMLLSSQPSDKTFAAPESKPQEKSVVTPKLPQFENHAPTDPVLFQTYVGNEQRQVISATCIPLDASYNNEPHQREYKIFKDILNQGLAENRPWGLVSWKFGFKTLVAESSFLEFAKSALAQGHDCVFINPMIGNEALFANVWEQGNAAHPGMSLISGYLEKVHGIDIRNLSGNDQFAFCNYFIATPDFWKKYTRFVDDILHSLDSASAHNTELAKVWKGSANYKKDRSITMQPFVIERLFSSFLRCHQEIRALGYPAQASDYTRKFGQHFGTILHACHNLKKQAIADPCTTNIQRWNDYRKDIYQRNLVKSMIALDDPDDLMIKAASHSQFPVPFPEQTMKTPPKILFNRHGALGDVLMITPMIKRLHASRSGFCEIHVETRHPDIFKNNPYVTSAHRPGENSGQKYDITFNLNGTYELNNDMHVMDAYEMHVFGNTTPHRQCQLFSEDTDRSMAVKHLSDDRKYIVMHMRNINNHLLNQQARNVDEAVWRKVIEGLLTATEFHIIQVGSRQDLGFSGSDRLIDLRDQLNLHELMELLAVTGRFAGVDSGPAHVAACTNADMLVLYTTAKSALRRPERSAGTYTGIEADIGCQGCLHRMPPGATDVVCARGDAACRSSFDPMAIVESIKAFA